MAKQYWLGEFFVDLSRNQISQHTQSQTLPPKALLVLTHLAENQGKVVSYDELLDKVWPNSVVTPNTLQRSIAQLRKALGENSKAQGIIKTHAKQGYSLECDVNWSEEMQIAAEGKEQELEEENTTELEALSNEPAASYNARQNENLQGTSGKKNRRNLWLASTMITALALILFTQWPTNLSTLQFSNLTYLTATDDKEYGGVYSADGDFIVFNRYLDKVCLNNIWAKNATTLEEIQLTSEQGTYGGHSFSADGSTLAFIKQEDCTKPITQNICYKLMTLDFHSALEQAQAPEVLLHCENSAISNPIWIDNQHIAMTQKDDLYWRLIRFSRETKSSTDLYEVEGGHVHNFVWSMQRQLFAVFTLRSDGLYYIDMLFADGSLKSSHRIRFPEGTPSFLKMHMEFIPNSEELLVGFGGQLYTLSEQGNVNLIDFPFDTSVGSPNFHPDGSRILLIKGRYDSDIAKINIAAPPINQDHSEIPLTVMERSNVSERSAHFRPDGKAIVMVSSRTGTNQVWLFGDQEGAKVQSQFPRRNYIRNLIWDANGTSLMVLADLELHHSYGSGKLEQLHFRYPILDLYHWDSEQHTAIANVLENGIGRFVKIDLNTMDYQRINNKNVNWAVKSDNGALVYMDSKDRFWKQGNVEDKLIGPLQGQGSSKRFVVDQEKVYGINRDNQLWSFDLETELFSLLGLVSSDIDYLTDIHNNELLATIRVSEKKEVIELLVEH